MEEKYHFHGLFKIFKTESRTKRTKYCAQKQNTY